MSWCASLSDEFWEGESVAEPLLSEGLLPTRSQRSEMADGFFLISFCALLRKFMASVADGASWGPGLKQLTQGFGTPSNVTVDGVNSASSKIA